MKSLLLCLLIPIFSGSLFAADFSFVASWNLFSPILSANQDATQYFTALGMNVQADISKIWTFDHVKAWSQFVPGEDNNTGNRFSSLRSGAGYWVLMNRAVSVTLPPNFSSYSLNLDGFGWRLIGLNSSQTVPLDSDNFLNDANFSTGNINEIRKIWGFSQSTSWQSFTPGSAEPSNSLASLDSGRAYWVFILSDLEINSQNVNLSDLFPPTCPGCPTIGE
jgi:hypothetical protein